MTKIDKDIKQLIDQAEKTLLGLLEEGRPLVVSYSSGKDSSTCLNLVLTASKKFKENSDHSPKISVLFADTGVENPEINSYAQSQMDDVRKYAKKNNLDVHIAVARPNLNDTFACRVIGGRALPAFPCSGGTGGQNRDCSLDWKRKPLAKERKKITKEYKKITDKTPVIIIGTRYEESTVRKSKMQERGEDHLKPWVNKDKNHYLSLIATWTTDDVWEYLGYVKNGQIEKSYTDFEETFRIYRDAGNTSCAIITELESSNGGGCGSRFGCYICTAVQSDKSMENMLKQGKYSYLRLVNKFRNYLINTQWDMSLRQWVGRSIDEYGFISIRPDAYAPVMLERLFRYALTIDLLEREECLRLGLDEPRFQMITLEQIILIDAMWSVQGLFEKPFHALYIFRDVVLHRNLSFVPDVDPSPREKIPTARKFFVGANWDEGFEYKYTGLQSAHHIFAKPCIGRRVLNSSGLEIFDVNTDIGLTIYPEYAYFMLEDDLDMLIDTYHNTDYLPTKAYFYHLEAGYMALHKGSESVVDEILRRTNFKVRHGMTGQISQDKLDSLLDSSISLEEHGKLVKKDEVTQEDPHKEEKLIVKDLPIVPVQLSLFDLAAAA